MSKQRRSGTPAVAGIAVIGSTVGGLLIAAGSSGVNAEISLVALTAFFLLALTLLVSSTWQERPGKAVEPAPDTEISEDIAIDANSETSVGDKGQNNNSGAQT